MNKSLIVLKPNENVYTYSILKNNTGWKLRRTHLTDQTKKKEGSQVNIWLHTYSYLLYIQFD